MALIRMFYLVITTCSPKDKLNPPVFNPSPSYKGSLFANETFKSKAHLRRAINYFHTKENIEIMVTRNSKSKLVVKCKDQGCEWMLYVTPNGLSSNWVIKTCPYARICRASAAELPHEQLTETIIGQEIQKGMLEDMDLTITKICVLVLKKFPNASPSYDTLWHARLVAITHFFGSYEMSYGVLLRFLEAIKDSNPGTKVDFQSDFTTQSGYRQFKRMAWGFGPCIQAFPHLRPLISVNARCY